jgi:phosphoribosylanthranilate isomerase
MIIKVCGLREPQNIGKIAAIQGIDLIGLIFYPGSPRYVDSNETAECVANLKNIGKVGVFVNASLDEVLLNSKKYSLDYLQLHGNETPEYILELRQKISPEIRFIKSFSIRKEEDLLPTSGYDGLCDFFLFDTPTSGYGGSGRSFDWKILQYYAGSTPFLLSGGIGPDSVEALGNFHHHLWAGLDLNSRFETAPGIKDVALLTHFIEHLKTK